MIMRTYWNISLSRNTGNSFETLIHFANVTIAGVHHAEDISDMNKKEITYLAQQQQEKAFLDFLI